VSFNDRGIITSEGATFKNTAHALMAANERLAETEKIKWTYHESNTAVSATIRTDL